MAQPKIAVVLHLYHAERWLEMATLIRHVPQPVSLFVSIREDSEAEPEILAAFPDADVRRVPNFGRDVWPFLALLPELMAFDLVCKIHTKKDDYRSRAHRIEALRGLLGGPALTSLIVDVFAATPELMIAGSGATFINGPKFIYTSGATMRAFQPNLPKEYGTFAGTMFWTRPSLFADFYEAFPLERFEVPIPGIEQLEHAIERLFCVRVAELGGTVGVTRIAGGVPEIELIPTSAPLVHFFMEAIERDMPNRYRDYPVDWYDHADLVARAPMGFPFGIP